MLRKTNYYVKEIINNIFTFCLNNIELVKNIGANICYQLKMHKNNRRTKGKREIILGRKPETWFTYENYTMGVANVAREMDWHLYTWGEHVKVIEPKDFDERKIFKNKE